MRKSRLYGDIERRIRSSSPAVYNNMVSKSQGTESNRVKDNNDPCMLRHTAGCSFKDETSFKSLVIDLEAYDYAA